jgi:NADH-quinone oxidoreductase subunit F
MDRMLLESYPYRIIEGVLIAAWAVGATEAFFYIRAEYPLGSKARQRSPGICDKNGIVGNNILGSGIQRSVYASRKVPEPLFAEKKLL